MICSNQYFVLFKLIGIKSMQCSTNFSFRESWLKGWQENLCKYALLIFFLSLGWKDETFSHSLGSKRRLFKWIQICLEDKVYNKSDFLIRNLSIVLTKKIKGKLQVHSLYST